MSIHKLTAGSGYDYLTRQVAAMDATHKGRVGLAEYYTAKGESPGRWVGSGTDGIDGLAAGDAVTAEQMQALFALGLHPLATERQAAISGGRVTMEAAEAAQRLGAPFKVYANDISPFRIAVAKRLEAVNRADGLPADWPVPAAVGARVRTEVATEFFRAEHGRDPFDARELAGTLARLSRPKTSAVAGYDLTFSPVKSVSALWAVADPAISAIIEAAHHAAVGDALRFIEDSALFTRTGANGVRQINVQGLVAAAFVHRDSRAGDPDLHTHVAVANKVQTLDGRWLAIDGRVLFKATVAASETYNTALEAHLSQRLGVVFTERPNPDPRKRPVREIVGVDGQLNARWSARRAVIDARQAELAAQFQHDHGRPPTPVEALHLAQRATLETRQAKHEPRSLAEQRATWRAQAAEVLGGDGGIAAMVHNALHADRTSTPAATPEWLDDAAVRVLTAVETRRSTWQMWHVRAEALRQVRELELPGDRVDAVVDQLTAEVLHRSTAMAMPDDGVIEPDALRRSDGASVYTVAGSDLYTSAGVLNAEQRLVETAGQTGGRAVPAAKVDLTLLELTANGVELDAGQAALVREMASSGRRLQLAIAPAGTGKTTAMAALAQIWAAHGGHLVGLAPSAAAAAQLRGQIDVPTDTLAKLTWSIDHKDLPDWAQRIGPDTLVIIDEAGMAGTPTLHTAVTFITGRGGSVRLVGDDQQLAGVGAGGVLRDIATTHGAVRLTELHRFTDRSEAAATLALRDGRPEALGFYLDHQRVHVGDLTTITDQLYAAWKTDRDAGLDAIMLAPTRALVAQLNARARADRLTGSIAVQKDVIPAAATVILADGNRASAGDVIITRRNDRRLRVSRADWVKNGDRWTVRAVHLDGSLTAQHLQHRRSIRLPADFIAGQVELGYATTVHAAQGVTADTTHGLLVGDESRQRLYTTATRGRHANDLYLQVVGDGDPHTVIRPELIHPSTASDTLKAILARDGSPKSATSIDRDLHDPAVRLGDAAARYLDALHAAATDYAGPELAARLDTLAEQLTSGITQEPAWPTVRAGLLLLHAHGHHSEHLLTAAAGVRELDTAIDRAAVLDHRLPHMEQPGPLPWLPGIPDRLASDPEWGRYLTGRARLVADLTDQVRRQCPDRPGWIPQGAAPNRQLIKQIEVWRAAVPVDPADRRPTGPAQAGRNMADWQTRLDDALAAGHAPAVAEWGPAIAAAGRSAASDPFLPILAERLADMSCAGIDSTELLNRAIGTRPLPDDHGAAALWWRIHDHLKPADAYLAAAGRPGPRKGGLPPAAPTVNPDPAVRWRRLADQLDPRLTRQSDWPALAGMLQAGHDQGHDMAAVARAVVVRAPLGTRPAQDLRYRLVTVIDPELPPPAIQSPRVVDRPRPRPIPRQTARPEPPRW